MVLASTEFEILIKLTIAMLLGVILGAERLYANKTAGMRTYALISMAAAFFVVISSTVSESFPEGSFDPMRIAGQVVVGVGFLGAGVIIYKNSQVRNLATASSMWVAAGIGMAVGFGFYLEAIFATSLTLFVLSGLALIEKKALSDKMFIDSHVHYNSDGDAIAEERIPRKKKPKTTLKKKTTRKTAKK